MEVMTRNSERFPGLSGISPPPKNSQTRQSGQPGLPVRIKDSASRMRTERGPPSAMALSPRAYRLLMARGLVYEESVPHRVRIAVVLSLAFLLLFARSKSNLSR
jgi:hypothetical protein